MQKLRRIPAGIGAFLIDYIGRHKHPVNAILHIVGVPLAFYGIFRLITGFAIPGTICIVLGYLLQYLGHKAQGNEVGEITLIKMIWRKITASKSKSKADAHAAGSGKAQQP